MQAPIQVFLGLGANLGDRLAALRMAVGALATRGVEPFRLSPLYDTDYVGDFGAQPPYLNAVVEARTHLAPLALLDVTQAIEREAGRAPDTHEQPRRLDIDILFYGDTTFRHPRLVVPHPRLAERLFVLQPLHDLGALAARPDLAAERRRLAAVQSVRPAGELAVGEWRAGRAH
jgi:2-amino-4-hydroxy-6-hydroxymethyldihydropteridine diphosphokinase